MKDSDPRPMPPEVQRAYRDPLNLTDLLESSVFTGCGRFDVRDELLERLTKKHGNVEVEIGKGTLTLPIRKRVAQFKKNVWKSIELMIAAEELGGRDAVMLELATVMQPHWLRWWDAIDWSSYRSMRESLTIASNVLGQRQIAWLAAQYARSAVVSSSAQDVALAAIESAEAWAVSPSEANREQAHRSAKAASSAVVAVAAAYAAYAAATSPHAHDAIAAYAAIAADAADEASPLNRLCELTKKLITPTLITHASRGLR